MNAHDKARIAWALKCKPEDVPDTPVELRQALDNRRSVLKAAKKVKHG